MQENTDKAILYNTIILYARLAITLFTGLFTTRFALQALGDVDFGLTSLVGSIIVFISIINTTMLSASNRFIAAAIGSCDPGLANKTFNVNLIIHFSVAILTLLIALPGGYWYITNYVNYNGPINNALMVFFISVTASALSFIGVPYNGLMLARERFFAFCTVEVIFCIFKLCMTYLILYYFTNKLFVYAATIGICTATPTLIYYLYCRRKFPGIIKFKVIKERKIYREILSFSSYIGLGAFVQIGQAQGAAIIINAFFNTLMNTAFSIANYLKSVVSLCTENLTKPIAPQITKCYASGNYERSIKLMTLISRLSFLITFLVSTPFLLETEFLISFWLGNVPPYSIIFSKLIILEIIINELSKGIAEYVFATGNIKWYQISVNVLLLISVIAGYLILKAGYPAMSFLYVYVIFAALTFIMRIIILKFIYKFDILRLFRESYLPCFLVVLFSIPVYLVKLNFHPIINILLYCSYVLLIIYIFGISMTEKKKICNILKRHLTK